MAEARVPGSTAPERGSRVRRFFLLGLAGILPLILSLWILVKAFQIVDGQVGVPLARGVEWILNPHPSPGGSWEEASPVVYRTLRPLCAFVVFLLAMISAGFLLASYVGRRILHLGERLFSRLPFVKAVFPHAKQAVDFFLGERTMALRRPVLVEYPRAGMRALGFVTIPSFGPLSAALRRSYVGVFVPGSPTPLQGWLIFFPEEEIRPVACSVDEAVRFLATAGVVAPGSPLPGGPPRV